MKAAAAYSAAMHRGTEIAWFSDGELKPLKVTRIACATLQPTLVVSLARRLQGSHWCGSCYELAPFLRAGDERSSSPFKCCPHSHKMV